MFNSFIVRYFRDKLLLIEYVVQYGNVMCLITCTTHKLNDVKLNELAENIVMTIAF